MQSLKVSKERKKSGCFHVVAFEWCCIHAVIALCSHCWSRREMSKEIVVFLVWYGHGVIVVGNEQN